MNNLDTSNPYNYKYVTKSLEIHILGGIKTNKLESLRVTLSIQKLKQHNVLRQSIDLYNDNLVEKLVRKCAERLEVGTSVIRADLQELTRELENYRFLLLKNEEQLTERSRSKQLSTKEEKQAIQFLKPDGSDMNTQK